MICRFFIYLFFIWSPLVRRHLLDHLLWSIFQSTLHMFTHYKSCWTFCVGIYTWYTILDEIRSTKVEHRLVWTLSAALPSSHHGFVDWYWNGLVLEWSPPFKKDLLQKDPRWRLKVQMLNGLVVAIWNGFPKPNHMSTKQILTTQIPNMFSIQAHT